MEIKVLQEDEEGQWDNFVDLSPQGSLFNKTWYIRALGLAYKIYTVQNNNEIWGGAILTKKKGVWTFGHMQKYTGILFKPFEGGKYVVETNRRNIIKLILEQLKAYKTFDYFFHPSFTDWLLFYQSGFKETTYYTYRISLVGASNDSLVNLCAPRLRTKIRKAMQDASMVIEESIDAGLFYKINSKTFERQGRKPPLTKERFITLFNALQQHNAIKLYGLKVDDGYTAVLGIAYDTDTAYLLFSGFDLEHKNNSANEWLIFNALCMACGKAKVFDFEGSMMPGVESFYRQFGGEFTPYFRIYKSSALNSARQAIAPIIKKIVGRK